MKNLEAEMMDMILEGQESGIKCAIDALNDAKQRLTPEQQTWDTAVALLEFFLEKAKEDRIK